MRRLPILRRGALRAPMLHRGVWLLRDEFTTALPAGSVNGTNCDPGPGTRYVADTGNLLSISGGELQFGGYTAENDPIYSIPVAIPRVAGRMMATQFTTPGAVNCFFRIGFGSASPETPTRAGVYVAGTSKALSVLDNSARPCVYLANSTAYKILTCLRATVGSFNFLKGGTFTNPTLLYVGFVGSGNPLYLNCATQVNAAHAINYVRIPQTLWLPTPLISDGFGGTLGTSDGLGHAEGVAGGIGSGGSGVSWTDSVGTWGISSRKAACSALSGGVGIATVNLGTANVHVIAAVARGAGNAGIVLRYVDSSNYVYAYHDGTNAAMVKVVAGTPTTLTTAAAAYSAGANLVAMCDGTEFTVWYNNTLIGTGTDPALPGGTRIGLYTTDTGNSFDNFNAWARGTEGQYSAALDRFLY